MVGMKDGDKWTLHESDGSIPTTFRVRVIDAPQTRYNENGIEIRRCRRCFSRMARINPTRPAWRGEEQRLAMIEAGDLEENTYWCEGHKRRHAPSSRFRDDSRDVEAHEWVKTERTPRAIAEREAEMAELTARWDAEDKAAGREDRFDLTEGEE